MSDFYEAVEEHHAALNRAVLLRDLRMAQDRADRRQSLIETLWIGLACFVLIGGAAVLAEVVR